MTATFHLRRAKNTDSVALARLAASFASVNPSPSLNAMNDLKKVQTSVEALLSAPHCHVEVAEFAGTVVAAMVLSLIPSLTHGSRNTLFVDVLVVAENYRRRGIATALIEYAIGYARSCNAYKLLLVTRDDNLPARALYKGLNFEINGVALALYLRAV